MGGLKRTLARLTRRFRPAAQAVTTDHYEALGPDLGRVRLAGGLSLYVDPQDGDISGSLIRRGYWERWTTLSVLSLIRPGDRIVEVGANLGYYTVLMADAVRPTGSVLALEANPRLADLAQRSLALNGLDDRARVLAQAALDRMGTVSFVTSRTVSGGGHVAVLDQPPFADSEVIEAPAARLDDLIQGRVDLIRMDAEGSEPFVMTGAERILSDNPDIVVCMEWSPVQIVSRTDPAAFVDRMAADGFRFWRMERDARLTPLSIDALKAAGHTDIVACRRDPRCR
ncbi:hypothetical protein KOAAANKH_00046 [Brevundimonas sp. NIBR10]|uniref:FkbM family methyltransferase n=1 Tax=Brevundimonas sp. NIBR10 TaxID=3015997 RepID=UPI0022F1BC64|nr:FkbM family methyltransferase [Brevundimonas sp. NIBR10]WGM45186.1 hypothetical protein KOAAANKH_00046 [Brevundimonas sp. NIBR10]